MVVFVDGAIVMDEKTVKVPKGHPLVEVRCGNCSHCRFVRELTRFAHICFVRDVYVDQYGEVCGDFKFRKGAAAEAKSVIASVNAVAEQYPDLKSQSNYGQLMTEISLMENHLAQSKKSFNEFVRDYNRYVRKFPTSAFLGWSGYETVKFDYYEAESDVRDVKPMKLF